MHVIVDVVFAVTIISIAFRTVPEFHIRIVCVCFAADRAFMQISFVFFGCFGGRTEMDGFRRPATKGVTCHLDQVSSKEQEIIQHCNDRDQLIDSRGETDDVKQEISRVQPGQPLDLDGDDEKEQDLHVWVKRGEREEHGKIQIMGAEADGRAAGQKCDQHARGNV